MNSVGIIGAGAAGIMAALAAAEAGADVSLFEKNNIVGKKMGITGKGRCNLTNAAPITDFIGSTPGNGKFLYSVYQRFTNEDLLECLHSWGLETKVERGGRVFPQSDSAVAVHDGRTRITTAKGRYFFDKLIIATGGMSYPVTGSTGDGYTFAAGLGHTIQEPRPSLIPFVSPDTWVHELTGLALKNVDVTLWKGKKKIASRFGEMLFTHFGISGPAVLMLSTAAVHSKKAVYPMEVVINLKPALSEEKLYKRLERDFELYDRKQAENAMKDLLPKRLIPAVLRQAEVAADAPVHTLSAAARLRIVQALQNLQLTVTGVRPLAEAIVTAGGVSVREINPKTMESKIVPNIYFAGEVTDIDAYTGGYNLQAAFSTGYAAGVEAAGGSE